MRTTIYAANNETIDIGKQGEYGVTTVYFPALTDSVVVLHQRSEDENPYSVPCSIVGDYVAWVVSATDTAHYGGGKCEVQYYAGGTLAKSVVYRTYVHWSIADAPTVTPTADATWVQTVSQKSAEAVAAAASATSSADVLIARATKPYLEIGNINTAGTDVANTKCIRSKAIAIDDDYTVSFSTSSFGYKYYIYYYESNGTVTHTSVTSSGTPTTISKAAHIGGSFRILIKNTDATADMTSQDIANIKATMRVQRAAYLRDMLPVCVTPEMFGACGNGFDDDTSAIQSALDVGGLVCLDSSRRYRITGKLKINKSGTILDGHGATIVSDVASGAIIVACGSAEEEHTIRSNIVARDGTNSYINIMHSPDGESGIAAKKGDTVVVQSQRDALHPDSGLYWCGTVTGSASAAHWAEPLTVNDPVGSRQLKCTGTLVYPFYLANKDDSVDTSAGARAHSTVRRVNFLRGVEIKNITIECNGGTYDTTTDAQGNVTVLHVNQVDNTIVFAMCRDSAIRNVSIRKVGSTSHGRSFVFQNCLACVFDNCTADASCVKHANAYDAILSDNHFTFSSSWYCRAMFCKSYHGGQTFDTTYSSVYAPDEDEDVDDFAHIRCPSVGTSISGCAVHGSTSSAATNHSGAWGVTISDCVFSNCANPVLLRSPHTTFTNNTIIGSVDGAYTARVYGIEITEPTVFQMIVANNTVTGTKGIHINPCLDDTRISTAWLSQDYLSAVGVEIYGNMLQDTIGAFHVERLPRWGQTADMCVDIHDNVVRGSRSDSALKVEAGNCNGVMFERNTLISCTSTSSSVTSNCGTSSVTVSGNKTVACSPAT